MRRLLERFSIESILLVFFFFSLSPLLLAATRQRGGVVVRVLSRPEKRVENGGSLIRNFSASPPPPPPPTDLLTNVAPLKSWKEDDFLTLGREKTTSTQSEIEDEMWRRFLTFPLPPFFQLMFLPENLFNPPPSVTYMSLSLSLFGATVEVFTPHDHLERKKNLLTNAE